MDFDPRIWMILFFGLGLMLAVSLEKALERFNISLPLVYVGAGWLIWQLPLGLPDFNPARDGFDAVMLEYGTEFIVIASLAAAGIAIDRPFTWKNWRQIWPLLVIAMPVTILAVGFLGWWGLGLAPASAILLGASLAPTDPVLARSVQVGPPGEGKRHDVRFSLTVEAGLNDGLAFPFTYLAIAAIGMTSLGMWTVEWAAYDLVYRIVVGCVVGYAVGRIGAWYVFEREADAPMDAVEEGKHHEYSTREGLIVLGVLLLSYGAAEVVEGYGFLAVFVAAVTARQLERRSRYHVISHHFIDQIEQIVLVAVLFGFGAMLASGVLEALTWKGALLGLALIFIIRPISGLLAEWRSPLPFFGTMAVAFLGVRGMGTIYYLAYGQNQGVTDDITELWAIASFAILLSIVVHGVLARPFLTLVEKRRHHLHRGTEDALETVIPPLHEKRGDERREHEKGGAD